MSAEEFAKSFSQNQNQNQGQNQGQQQQQNNQVTQEVTGNKSAEEIAEEFKKGLQNSTDNTKTPEEKAEDERKTAELAAAEAAKANKVKLDDGFKQTLDKLFKENKLSPYSDGTETGYVLPETFDEVLELIEDNKKSWIESAKAKDQEELIEEVLSKKSPAWQFLIKNSELYENPADLVPLITAVQNQEYSNNLDPTNEADQEKIIRASLSIQGLPASAIEEEITDLKERDRLGKKASDLKPVLDKYNAEQTAKELGKKTEENKKTKEFWDKYYNNLEETVFKSKDLDGVKLKNEHKQLIASALIPNDEIGGLPIYSIIENLVATGNLKVLSKMTLLGLDESLFDNYFITNKADKKAESVQRVLRQQNTGSGSSDSDQAQKINPIKKSSYGYFG